MAIENIADVAEVSLNNTTCIRVGINKMTGRGGSKFAVDVRRWYVDDTDEWAPTSKGISIPFEKFDEVAEAIASIDISEYISDDDAPVFTPSKPTGGAKKAASKKAPAKKAAPKRTASRRGGRTTKK